MKGDAPERVAVLVDRESVRTGATPNLREVSFLSTVEGMPSRWGIIARVRIDCEAKTLLELGRVQFSAGGGRKDIPPPTDTMSPIAPDSALYGVVAGICDGDWRGPTAVDVPAARIGPALFKS